VSHCLTWNRNVTTTARNIPDQSTERRHRADVAEVPAGNLSAMHPSARHVADVLASLGATGQVRELPEPAPTAAAAAAQLGCEIGAIANSLIFDADGAPLLILTSGAHRVDTTWVAQQKELGSVRRASPDFVRSATGQAIGGVAPVGHPSPVRTLVDTWLRHYDMVWAAGGHQNTVFPTSYDELLRITGGEPAEVSADLGAPGS
jgi:prolyl-tRNA editing enzyme YbaK/EbsC (Cys-tRNA(Pro) deacylase)